MSLKERSTPWCTIVLVLGTISCNFLVFLGNKWTSEAFNKIGLGTKGWSNVGLGIAESLRSELDEKMNEVSTGLLDALKHIQSSQETLDMVLSIAGNETDNAINNSQELSLLEQHGPERGLALIQEFHGKNSSHVANLTPVITTAILQVVDMVFAKVNTTMLELMDKLLPALMQVGQWVQKFGEKVTKGLEEFSQTLDKAQKIFDQVMSELNKDAGKNEDDMVEQTLPLFDTENSGSIKKEDLEHIGEWFSISALTGSKPAELVEKYDTNKDGTITRDDFLKLVNDPSIPGSMSIILRRYGKKLAEIGGNVGRAKMRDEVAYSVSNYIRLVCAKNMTKVGWVADRLTNDSVPLDFTATVLVEMCLSTSDPNAPIFTLADTGEIMIQTMMNIKPQPVLDALELIANTSWYHSQGLDIIKQPGCLEMVTKWVTKAQMATEANVSSASSEQGGGNRGFSFLLAVDELESMDPEQHAQILEGLPKTAFVMAEEGVRVFRMERQQAKQKQRKDLFGSKTSLMLLARLLGGKAPSDIQSSSAVDEAINSGVPAAPTTLEFAKFLMWNATSNANIYMKMSADYAGDSSNPVDDIASKINGMVKKVESFINMMGKYTTPKGIRDLKTKIDIFLSSALDNMKDVIESRLVALIGKTVPEIEEAVHKAAHDAGTRLGAMLGNLLASPIGSALGDPMKKTLSDGLQSEEVGETLGGELSNSLSSGIVNMSAATIGDNIGNVLDNLLGEAIEKGPESFDGSVKKLPAGASLLATNAHHQLSFDLALDREIDFLFSEDRLMGRTAQHPSLALLESSTELDIEDTVLNSWTGIVSLLRSFSNLLPKATKCLKDARSEVTKLASNLDSIFGNFADTGQDIFDKIASIWTMVWMIYFVFILPFCLWTLYYGFWANGWFGGPQPITKDASAPPEGFLAKCKVLCTSCCAWCSGFHDTDLCFWSVIIFMQAIILLTFIIAIVLAIVAGVKAFLLAGCSMIYVLQDDEVCLGALGTMRNFLETFQIGSTNSTGPLPQEEIDRQCGDHVLTTCNAITALMMKSTIFTVSFGFVGSIFALQMLFDSATLHEQAAFRRRYAEMQKSKSL